MKLISVGLSTTTTSLDNLSKLVLTEKELAEAMRYVKHLGLQTVILSTCNRIEMYMTVNSKIQGETLFRDLMKHLGKSKDYNPSRLSIFEHQEAVRHLFEVTCGLDSMVLGETEILGQVRSNYGTASEAGIAKGILGHVFHQALRVGKRARTETGISKNPLSVSSACVEFTKRVIGKLPEKSALIIGAGEAGRLAGQALKDNGIGSITVTNRTRQKSFQIAEDLGGTSVPFGDIPACLEKVDLVITATGSTEFVLRTKMLEKVIAKRSNRPLFIFDIGVPADVEPSSNLITGVTVCGLENLRSISEKNRLQRKAESIKVGTIIEMEVANFLDWWERRRATPTVISLQEEAERIRAKEWNKTLKSLSALSEMDRDRMERITKSLVKSLLHRPIIFLRDNNSEDDTRTVEKMFGLDKQDDTE